MNCAIHGEVPAVAYCRTCGKALCASCKRDVRGVIYCENCLAQRLQDVMPPASAAVPPPGQPPMGYVPAGPNPGLAAVLAAFFPFGVGAVYCGQYAKGLAHMLIFAFLVWGASTEAAPEPIFGLAIAFFYVYQLIDAYRTAKAVQLGQPPPDPFGLGRALGTGQAGTGQMAKTSNVPVGALILIGLGVIFLLGNLGIFEFGSMHRYLIPLALIGLGAFLLLRRLGTGCTGCECAHCRTGGAIGPVMLLTFGVLLLLSAAHAIAFSRTWPILLLLYGGMRLLYSNASTEGHIEPSAPPATGAGPSPPPASSGAAVKSTGEVDHV